MSDTQRPPLWRVMADAFDEAAVTACRYPRMLQHCKAAEIRALRDEVVQEEDLHEFMARVLLPKDIAAAKWAARHEIRALLTAEAERAERGDE